MAQKISITISDKVFFQIANEIKKRNISNRSEFIEELIRDGLNALDTAHKTEGGLLFPLSNSKPLSVPCYSCRKKEGVYKIGFNKFICTKCKSKIRR